MGRNAIIKTDGSLDYDKIGGFDDQIGNLSKDVQGKAVNIMFPPAPLVAAKGDGVTDDKAAIQSAINALTSGGVLTFPVGTYIVASNLTIPANITLLFVNGAKLKPSSGIAVTINGPIIAGMHQIFTGAGTIAGLSNVPQLYPQWWGASGSNQSTTGSITAGSTSLTLAAALDFQNGQGIAVNHAGAACTLATPAAPTVTPTGTAGTTSYQYQIVALDANGGCTAAGTTGTMTTGNATLSATNYNALSWTAVTSAWLYAIYGRVSGTMQLLAIVSGTSWNDTGVAAITAPSILPSSPPSTSLADTLITTILSGSGTTTLTLAVSATAAGTSQTVIHDDTAAMQASINYSNNVFIQSGVYNTTSPLVYSQSNLNIVGQNVTITGETVLLQAQPYANFVNNQLLTNISIRGITFKTKTLAFSEIRRVLKIGGVDGFKLEDCSFIGFNGDAIEIDNVYGTAANIYLSNVTKNITIKKCKFDGINNQNRNAITIFQGKDIFIENNEFKNCTKSGMPGAIDIEPWLYHTEMEMIQNVYIKNNKFYNIQGTGGVVNIFFDKDQTSLTYPFKNIQIEDNEFGECYGLFFFIQQSNGALTFWDSNDITIKGNTFNGSTNTRWQTFSLYGVRNVSISENTFNNYHGVAYMGAHPDVSTSIKNIDVTFDRNKFNNLSPDTTASFRSIIELGINDTFDADRNIFTAHDALFSAYRDVIIFRYIPKTAGSAAINNIFQNNIVRNVGIARIVRFLQDSANSGLTAPILLNNHLGTGITERSTT